MSSLGWLGDLARDAYCQADDYVDGVNEWLLGTRFANAANGIQDWLGLNPCEPNPPPPPGEGFPNPQCNGQVDHQIVFYRGGDRNDFVFRGGQGYACGGPTYNAADGWGYQFCDPVTGFSGRSIFSIAEESVPHTVVSNVTTPRPGVVCNNIPPPLNERPPAPPPRTVPPTRITPPPPAPQVPIDVTINFFPPINLPGIIPVVIPVIANITPTVNFSPTFNIPFTLELPDFNANFDFAFNPHFNLVNIEGELINFPPEGIPPEEVIDGGSCPEIPPPQYKIEERIIGAYVHWPVGLPVRGKTRVFRGSSEFNESIYPRYGHVQFVLSDVFNLRVASAPVTERFGFVPCPYPYGASSAQWHPEPGFEGASVFAVRQPIAIPVNPDGTRPTGLGSMLVL